MPAVDIQGIRDQISRLTNLKEAIKAALAGQLQAIKAAVDTAHAEDAAANDATNAAVQAAIDQAATDFAGANDEISTAVVAGTGAGGNGGGGTDPNIP